MSREKSRTGGRDGMSKGPEAQRRVGLGDAHQLLEEVVPKTEARMSAKIIPTKRHVGRACLSPRDRNLGERRAQTYAVRLEGGGYLTRSLCFSGKSWRAAEERR